MVFVFSFKSVFKLTKPDSVVIYGNHMPTGVLDAGTIVIYPHIKPGHMPCRMKMIVYKTPWSKKTRVSYSCSKLGQV